MTSSQNQPLDPGRRQFLGKALRVAAGGTLLPRAARAGLAQDGSATRRIPLRGIAPGAHVTRRIGGYPVIVLNRTKAMLATLRSDTARLADPDSRDSQQPGYARNPWRSRVPQWLVLVNHCTFDGCRTGAQTAAPAIFAGFGCPCCGSRYDIAGRVFKSQPAPRNMAVPAYNFLADNQVIHVAHVPQVKTEKPDRGGSD